MTNRRQLLVSRSWHILWSIAIAFIVLQLGFTLVVDTCFPVFYDREAQQRLNELKQHMARNSERPLLLLLGSSRTAMSFRPEILECNHTESPGQLLVYNYSHLGGTPAFHLLQLKRLLAWGIRPQFLVVELMPPVLSNPVNGLLMETTVGPELPLVMRYCDAAKLVARYCAHRVLPWQRNRVQVLRALAPDWLEPARAVDLDQLSVGPFGWENRFWKREQTAKRRDDQLAMARANYGPRLAEFQIKEDLVRPLLDLLALCVREKMPVVLVMTPESRAFRSWYRLGSEDQIQVLCARLTRNYGVPLVDARAWLDDEDFMDGHHVLPQGADNFTRRLEIEVLKPFVAGDLPGLPNFSRLIANR